MARSRALARSLFRKQQRSRYSHVKTKVAVRFLITVALSIYIGTYLEQNGTLILEQGYLSFQAALNGLLE